MKNMFSPSLIRLAGLAAAAALLVPSAGAPAHAQKSGRPPALVITDQPLPPDLTEKVYQHPRVAPAVSPDQLIGSSYYQPAETVVGRKVEELRKELTSLQGNVSGLSEKLTVLENEGQARSADYYANVATISTQLQSGTTPGNPRLVQRLSLAQQGLESLAGNVVQLNQLAVDVSQSASMANFLLEAARSTYSLSGAVEEDHVRLSQLEDVINNTLVVIERLLNNVNDDITRTAAYLSSERGNLRTLSLAISTGDLYGKSLSNRPFSNIGGATPAGFIQASAATGAPAALSSPRPLVKIRFDDANVDYEQPVYMAVSEALERYPQARFELIAVHPTAGNAAQVAIESTRARRNAEKVLRTLTQMGLPLDRIDLSYTPSADVRSNEVHLFIR